MFTVTFTYADGDVSVHDELSIESARNLATYNLENDGLLSVLITVGA